jgi:L-fucose isomerase-like protein
MPSDNPDTQRKNDVILREAQKRFAEDVIEQLRRQPNLFGTLTLELSIQGGEITLFRLRSDQTIKT